MMGAPLRGFVVACLALCSVAQAEDEAPTKHELMSRDGTVRVWVPVSWKLTEKNTVPTEALNYRVKVPGSDEPIDLRLYNLPGVQVTARAQALIERPAQRKRYETEQVEARFEPLPHLLIHYTRDDREKLILITFTRIRGHGLHLRAEGPKEVVAPLVNQLIEAALTIRAEVKGWPAPLPDTYTRKESKGIAYYLHPKVEAGSLKAIKKVISATTKAFQRRHGPVRRPKDEPLVVVVHKRKKDATPVSKNAAEYGTMGSQEARRLYALVLPESNGFEHGRLSAELVDVLLHERYRTVLPSWFVKGEGWLAACRQRTGKKGPLAPSSWYTHVEPLTTNLNDLGDIEESDWGAYVDHARVYLLLFRHGPSKYKKAYRGFLKAIDETGDAEVAMRQLLLLDMAQLRVDARNFLRTKVRPVVGK